jgi:hypothetical protein
VKALSGREAGPDAYVAAGAATYEINH